MTNLVLFILAAMWAFVLVPPWLKNRGAETRGRNSIGNFQNQLNVLGRSAPRSYRAANAIDVGRAPIGARIAPDISSRPLQRSASMPTSASEAEQRRGDIVRMLLAGMGISFIAWLIFSSPSVLTLHLTLDVLFFGYIALIVRARRSEGEAAHQANVHYLPQTQPVRAERPVLVRRSGS
ncbi:MAG: hypothetical protein ACC652_09490 [Acidimicrobiales bacterium]